MTKITSESTRFDGKLIFSGSTLRSVNLLVQAAISFFLMPLIVRSLGDEMYGFWALTGSVLALYGLLDLGLSTAISRQIAHAQGASHESQTHHIYSTAIILYTLIALLAGIITAGIAAGIGRLADHADNASVYRNVVLIVGLNFAASLPFRVQIGMLTANLRFDIISGIQIGTSLLRAAAIAAFLAFGYKITSIAVITLASSSLGFALYYYYAKKTVPGCKFKLKDVNSSSAKMLFSYSLYAFISQVADIMRFQVDLLVIFLFLDLALVAHYKIAGFMVSQFIALIKACMGVMVPVFSKLKGANEIQRIESSLYLSTKICIYLSTFVGFGLIAWGSSFIEAWLGAAYLDAYPCLVILSIGALVAMWQNPSVSLIYGLGKHKWYAYFNLIEGFANLTLSCILVKQYGLIGIALGTVIPMLIIKLVFQPIYICRVCSLNYTEFLQRSISSILSASAFLIVPLFISKTFLTPSFASLFIVGGTSFCMYLATVWAFGFTKKESKSLANVIHRRNSVQSTA